ncbi:centrosomal protein of 44 kDa-like [Physella acuta]|uniref:centrosomal protein of 44 kDa-like n=1 Tax=Physella acuta TaxID=109671 RepID=UPI0027DD9765|nr:centrosomal protein of 44 kDa-like [Physella acuta]
MATGDIKNNIKQLQHELKASKFSENLDVDGLVSGSPKTYLSIYHYLFTSYSTKFNKDIANSNNELYGKSDMRFMEAVYKILRDMFDYKPQIHREQFFSPGFAERKIIMATDILKLIKNRYKPVKSSTFKVASIKDESTPKSEKILQEPHERTRKIASKSSTSIAGAVILPVRMSSGFLKVSKSAYADLRISEGAGFDDEEIEITKNNNKQARRVYPTDEISFSEIKDTAAQQAGKDVIIQSKQVIDPELLNAEVRRKVVDLISPALLKINEQIGKLSISLKNLELKQTPKPTEEPQSSTALTAGIAKQMNDVIFKLDTLTSRVVLIENRLTILESKVENDQSSQQKFGFNSSSQLSHKHLVGHNREKTALKFDITNSVKIRSEDKDEQDSEDEVENSCVEGKVEDVNFKVVRESHIEKDPKIIPGLIKSLVGTFASDPDCDIDVKGSNSKVEDKSNCENTPLKPSASSVGSGKPSSVLQFVELFSPIQAYKENQDYRQQQDDSSFAPPYSPYNMDNNEKRRSSTPTQLNLDTSTLDRVTRITQMMEETKQLLH